jgi:hypothetical protein
MGSKTRLRRWATKFSSKRKRSGEEPVGPLRQRTPRRHHYG